MGRHRALCRQRSMKKMFGTVEIGLMHFVLAQNTVSETGGDISANR